MELYDKPKTIEAFNECLKEVGLASCEKPKSLNPSVPNKSKTSFIDFFHDELASERIEIRTRQAREVVFKSLLTFGRIQAFEDLTPANILEYHKWLNADGERNETTVKSYHKRLHRYVIKAYEYGRVAVGRSKSVSGPYLDRNGKDMLMGGGTLFLEGDKKEWEAAGHCAAYTFDGEDVFICHGYSATQNGAAMLIQRPINWTADGWPELGN